ESGTLGLFNSSGAPGWSAVTTDPHAGLYSAYAPDVSNVADQRLTLSAPIAVPPNTIQATLSFWHRYNLEVAGAGRAFDGGVLEMSTNGGATWADASITSGGYNNTIGSPCSSPNPLAGRRVWSGDSGGWQQVTADLTPYRGANVLFRLRL